MRPLRAKSAPSKASGARMIVFADLESEWASQSQAPLIEEEARMETRTSTIELKEFEMQLSKMSTLHFLDDARKYTVGDIKRPSMAGLGTDDQQQNVCKEIFFWMLPFAVGLMGVVIYSRESIPHQPSA